MLVIIWLRKMKNEFKKKYPLTNALSAIDESSCKFCVSLTFIDATMANLIMALFILR